MRRTVIAAVEGALLMAGLVGCGKGSGSLSTTPPPPPTPSEFIYGSNLAYVIAAEKLDTTSGALTNAGSTPGGNAVAIAANPAGTFLYALDAVSNGVDGFSISSNGSLTKMTGSPFAGPGLGGIEGLEIDPSGKFLFATSGTTIGGNSSGLIGAFVIDGTTGTLSAVSGSPFAAGVQPTQLAVHPSGKFLFVSDGVNGVLAFSINPSSGVLTPVSGAQLSGGTQGIAVDPAGKYLYAVDLSNAVYAYSIDSSTGALLPVSGSPFFESSGLLSGYIILSPSGKFLYTLDALDSPTPIYGFSINSSTGALSTIPGSPFPGPNTMVFSASLAIDPAGTFLYASCSDGNCGIMGFNIDATTGALTSITGSPFNSAYYVGRMTVVRTQ